MSIDKIKTFFQENEKNKEDDSPPNHNNTPTSIKCKFIFISSNDLKILKSSKIKTKKLVINLYLMYRL